MMKKVTMLHRKDEVMRELNKYQFSHPGDLEAVREEVEEEFARWYWDGDVDRAREELQESLRELVIWERNTIWRVGICHHHQPLNRLPPLKKKKKRVREGRRERKRW